MAAKTNEAYESNEKPYTEEPPQYQVMQRGAIQDQHAVLQQPQIITAQPSSVAVTTVNIVDVPTRQIVDVNPGTRDWSTGLFGCCNDIAGCLCTMCCLWIDMRSLAYRLGESPMIVCCVPGAMIILRTKLRLLTGIKGSVCNDCCAMTCCFQCALCQLKREMDNSGIPQAGCC